MTTTRKPDLAKVRAASKEMQKFDTWVDNVLVKEMDGKVEYIDRRWTKDNTYHFNPYSVPQTTITKTGIRIAFISPAYGHNETDTYLGSVELTWAQINKIVPAPRKAVKR